MFTNVNKPHSNSAMLTNEMESNQSTPPSSAFLRPSVLAGKSSSHEPFSTALNIEQLPSTVNLSHGSQYPFHHHTIQPSTSTQSPPATSTPWQCPVWMTNPNILPGSLMTFDGQRQPHVPIKRKASNEWSPIIKSKQLVTEEKMAAYLNSIHISSEYTSHSTGDSTTCEPLEDDSNTEIDQACSVQDIEQKLRQANRITVSDVVRTIRDDPLLPAAIMERYERPSKALVLWQPPQRLTDLITARSIQESHQNDDDINNNNNNNNNVEFADASGEAQMDMDT